MPLLALAFVMANRHRLALYGEGKFQAEIDDYLVDILLQDEDLVALRRVDVDAFRGAVLDGVARAVKKATGQACPPDPLEVARRLVRFARDLPPWSQKTLSLSASTTEVRHVLLRADDPHKALFVDIPTIFGDGDASAAAAGIEAALRELSDAYPKMMTELSHKMLSALGQTQDDLAELHERARVVADLTGDLRVDAFAGRLATYRGEISEIEAIASLAINRPPRDWTDRDPDQAALALADFALKFRRAEDTGPRKGSPADARGDGAHHRHRRSRARDHRGIRDRRTGSTESDGPRAGASQSARPIRRRSQYHLGSFSRDRSRHVSASRRAP